MPASPPRRIQRSLARFDAAERPPGKRWSEVACADMLAELNFKVVYEYEDEQSLERHTRQAEDLTRQALAGHAAMYDVEVTGRKAPIDGFEPQ